MPEIDRAEKKKTASKLVHVSWPASYGLLARSSICIQPASQSVSQSVSPHTFGEKKHALQKRTNEKKKEKELKRRRRRIEEERQMVKVELKKKKKSPAAELAS